MQEERLSKIMDYLSLHSVIKLKDICTMNKVSIDTVRRDVARLVDIGSVKKTHGGITLLNADPFSFESRKISNYTLKQELANTVAKHILDDSTLALNHCTTNIEIAKALKIHRKNMTIITNSLKIVDTLSGANNFNVILLGGVIDFSEYSTHSNSIDTELSPYNIDLAIITVNALSLEDGLMDFRIKEVPIIKAMIKAAKKSIIAADSTKFESTAFLKVAPLNLFQAIITDTQIPETILNLYKNHNITVITS